MDESALERYFDDSIANVSKDVDSSDLMLLSTLKSLFKQSSQRGEFSEQCGHEHV